MRKQNEILDKIKEIEKSGADFLGYERGDLIQRLDFDNAKDYLKKGVTEEEWEGEREKLKTPSKQIKDYMGFAWGKANDCRGISAQRSISHFLAWIWLDGEDDLYEEIYNEYMYNYHYYGKPILEKICTHYSIDFSKYDDGIRTNTDM